MDHSFRSFDALAATMSEVFITAPAYWLELGTRNRDHFIYIRYPSPQSQCNHLALLKEAIDSRSYYLPELLATIPLLLTISLDAFESQLKALGVESDGSAIRKD